MTLINNKTTETIVIEEIPIELKYWINTPQIDANTEISNLSSWWIKVKTWQVWVNSTWSLSVSWIWFTPKLVKFYAVGWKSMSLMETDWITPSWIRMYNSSDITRYTHTNRAAELYDETSDLYALSDFSFLDSDWFTINTTTLWFSYILRYTCIW